MRRRAVVALALAAPFAPGLAREAPLAGVPADGVLRFDVFRHGSRIGTHQMRFARQGAALEITTDVRLAVSFGPLTLFRYRHLARERWEDGRFSGLETTTDHNGTPHAVSARATASGVEIVADGNRIRAEAGAAPLTHWNRSVLLGPMFNPENGRILHVAASPSVDGGIRLSGDASLTDWYDPSLVWRALSAKAEDGSELGYRRV